MWILEQNVQNLVKNGGKLKDLTNSLFFKPLLPIVNGRVWKKLGLGGYGYNRKLKCRVWECRVLKSSGLGGFWY